MSQVNNYIKFNIVTLQEVGEPSKEEKAVAKFLRFNCPTKSTNMMGHRVDYFIGRTVVSELPTSLETNSVEAVCSVSKVRAAPHTWGLLTQ